MFLAMLYCWYHQKALDESKVNLDPLVHQLVILSIGGVAFFHLAFDPSLTNTTIANIFWLLTFDF
jgi:hypothetical protein